MCPNVNRPGCLIDSSRSCKPCPTLHLGRSNNSNRSCAWQLAGRWSAGWVDEKKFDSRLAKKDVAGRRLILCQPQTFMNASGASVAKVAEFYKIPPERILVAVDDADLPLGEIRLRPRGSSGGHHGLESIGQHLGADGFPRLRIGIGRSSGEARQITGYVLEPFRDEERKVLEKALGRAGEQVECWLNEGIDRAMNRFNGAADASEKKKTE